MVNIHAIETACNDGRISPGIETVIAIVAICGVLTIPTPADYDPAAPDPVQPHTITADIGLKAGYHFTEFHFRKKEATYSAQVAGEEDAEFVNATLNFYIPKISPLTTLNANNVLNNRYLVLFKDRVNDDYRVMGEIGNGASIKFTEQTNPKNGYQVTIEAQELDDYPAYYTGAVPTE